MLAWDYPGRSRALRERGALQEEQYRNRLAPMAQMPGSLSDATGLHLRLLLARMEQLARAASLGGHPQDLE